jgi:hypothetical protein
MILELTDYKIRFIDSLNFIPSKLSSFPKTFGFEELEKGYFPHFFNTTENQNYTGQIPDKKYFGYDSMSFTDKSKFDAWHTTYENKEYVFHEEIIKYCKMDVDILRRGALKFRDIFLDIGDCDPFRYISLASICMAIFTNKFLPSNLLGLIPVNGFDDDNHSEVSMEYLNYIMQSRNIQLRTALDGGGKHIRKFKADGYHEETRHVYEFHGKFTEIIHHLNAL